MKFLLVDTYYASFMDSLYAQNPDLDSRSYGDQFSALMQQSFGTADYYSHNLRLLGHEAQDIVANCASLQRQWAREHELRVGPSWLRPGFGRYNGIPIPTLRRDARITDSILAAQIRAYRPDVLYLQDLHMLSEAFIREAVRPYVKLVVGQHASKLPPVEHFRGCDLIISSLPNQVEKIREVGVKAEYLPLAFEARLVDQVGLVPKQYSVVHTGGYAGIHKERTQLLEQVAEQVDLDFWGYGVEALPKSSAIHRKYHGQAWGIDMYRVRASGRVVLTKHITSVAGPFANNMTLFETTGIGSLLVTDHKANLSKLFEPGKEIVVYNGVQDCVEKIRYYLEHDEERESIAKAGQRRTLREHTYQHRMQELLSILKRHM